MAELKEQFVGFIRNLQDEICSAVEELDGKAQFQEDHWERPGGGGGRTRILQGQRIAKGGVNFSAVHGEMPERVTHALGVEPGRFLATGVSIVQHPVSPMVPIIHMNVRYFEMENGLYWFGGGIDLTPHIGAAIGINRHIEVSAIALIQPRHDRRGRSGLDIRQNLIDTSTQRSYLPFNEINGHIILLRHYTLIFTSFNCKFWCNLNFLNPIIVVI